MRIFVTGGTGFIGSRLIQKLSEKDHEVIVLSRKDHTSERGIKYVKGDILDRGTLLEKSAGCDVIYHLAGFYSSHWRHKKKVHDINHIGSRNIFSAALENGVKKVIFTSTSLTFGVSKDSKQVNEESENTRPIKTTYVKSKILAEEAASEFSDMGLKVVTLNPTYVLGRGMNPLNAKIIRDFLSSRLPGYIDGGLNLVDVSDVVDAHISALKNGRPGEKYILGNANLSYNEFFSRLSSLSGVDSPKFKYPYFIAYSLSKISRQLSRVLNRSIFYSPDEIKFVGHYHFFDSSKAIKELKMPQTNIDRALLEVINSFHEKKQTNAKTKL